MSSTPAAVSSTKKQSIGDMQRDDITSLVKMGTAGKQRGDNVTPSQARRQRPSSVSKTRFTNNNVEQQQQTLSSARYHSATKRQGISDQITPSQARRDTANEQYTPSQARQTTPHSVVKKKPLVRHTPPLDNGKNSTPDDDDMNNNTPLAQTKYDSPSIDNIVDRYLEHEDICIEGKEVKFHDDNMVDGQESSAALDYDRNNNKPKQQQNQLTRSRSTPKSRPRTATTPSTTRSNNSIKQQQRRRSNNDAHNEKKAMEEWKKKEEEQWALIKNMRRRQETALREAEGKRERVRICIYV